MKSHVVEADAVLKAPDAWVTAQEALVAAKRVCDETRPSRRPPISPFPG
jgi:hypothetical protein